MSHAQDAFQEDLQRGLKERHIQLIAIGGAIGVGLFLGSSSAIQVAGPALMISYLIGAIMIFFVMRALGEVAVAHPVSGSFSAYANVFLGPRMGYITGWTYWFMWLITCMAEITAVGVYCHFWFPDIPQWIPALVALGAMMCVNLATVKAYGEFEFWFALVKVVTIVAMIIMGLLMITLGIGRGGQAIGISNLWSHGGFMPYGIKGIALAMTMVMFAYVGVELIGVTAGEAADPKKSIPAAIDKVFWRVLIFYIGALFVIMSIFPWNEIGTKGSPFVLVFQDLGIAKAAGIINFVVLTAALSSCNSGIFSTGRMLYNLALQKRAPAMFGKLSSTKVPARGILFSGFFLLIGVLLNYVVPEKVFVYVTSVAAFAALWIWGTIVVVQMRSRKGMTKEEVAKLDYPMILYPISNYVTLAFLVIVAGLMLLSADTRVAMIVGPLWLICLYLGYNLAGYHKEDAVQGAKAEQSATAERRI